MKKYENSGSASNNIEVSIGVDFSDIDATKEKIKELKDSLVDIRKELKKFQKETRGLKRKVFYCEERDDAGMPLKLIQYIFGGLFSLFIFYFAGLSFGVVGGGVIASLFLLLLLLFLY
jgi:hypothetical protein